MSSSSRRGRHSDSRRRPPGDDLVESIQSAVTGAITSVLAPMLQNLSLETQGRGNGTIESRVGRPPVVINMEDVELLHRFHFTWCQIADILEVSRSTLYRRIQDEGLTLDLTFTNITDSELDHHVEAIKRLYLNDGERLMIGHLRPLGIYVS